MSHAYAINSLIQKHIKWLLVCVLVLQISIFELADEEPHNKIPTVKDYEFYTKRYHQKSWETKKTPAK